MLANPPDALIRSTLAALNPQGPDEDGAHGWLACFFLKDTAHRPDIARDRRHTAKRAELAERAHPEA